VRIEVKGFKSKYFSDLNTTMDINLGDIGLVK
jgi:hypothetical protein